MRGGVRAGEGVFLRGGFTPRFTARLSAAQARRGPAIQSTASLPPSTVPPPRAWPAWPAAFVTGCPPRPAVWQPAPHSSATRRDATPRSAAGRLGLGRNAWRVGNLRAATHACGARGLPRPPQALPPPRAAQCSQRQPCGRALGQGSGSSRAGGDAAGRDCRSARAVKRTFSFVSEEY